MVLGDVTEVETVYLKEEEKIKYPVTTADNQESCFVPAEKGLLTTLAEKSQIHNITEARRTTIKIISQYGIKNCRTRTSPKTTLNLGSTQRKVPSTGTNGRKYSFEHGSKLICILIYLNLTKNFRKKVPR